MVRGSLNPDNKKPAISAGFFWILVGRGNLNPRSKVLIYSVSLDFHFWLEYQLEYQLEYCTPRDQPFAVDFAVNLRTVEG